MYVSPLSRCFPRLLIAAVESKQVDPLALEVGGRSIACPDAGLTSTARFFVSSWPRVCLVPVDIFLKIPPCAQRSPWTWDQLVHIATVSRSLAPPACSGGKSFRASSSRGGSSAASACCFSDGSSQLPVVWSIPAFSSLPSSSSSASVSSVGSDSDGSGPWEVAFCGGHLPCEAGHRTTMLPSPCAMSIFPLQFQCPQFAPPFERTPPPAAAIQAPPCNQSPRWPRRPSAR